MARVASWISRAWCAVTQTWLNRGAEDALLKTSLGQVLHQDQAMKPRREGSVRAVPESQAEIMRGPVPLGAVRMTGLEGAFGGCSE